MLYPLAEIAPDLIFPDGEPLASCLKRAGKRHGAVAPAKTQVLTLLAPTAQQTRPPGDWRN